MIVLVCGSRKWDNREIIAQALYDLHEENVTVIHGDAKGADRIAGDEAEALYYQVHRYPANWDRYGKLAGFKRNLEMLDQEPDLVLAFQVGKSRGTQHTIDHARKRGIPVKVYNAS